MSRRRTAVFAALATVLAVLAAAWLMRTDAAPTPEKSGPPRESSATNRPAEAPRPATLVGREPAARIPSEPSGATEAPPADACVVEGAVVFADGKPAAGTAVQALFAEDTPSNGTRTFGEGVVTGDDGRFRLLVAGSGAALIVAAKRDAKPTAFPATIAPGKRVDTGTLRLASGAILAGRVKCGGVPKEKITVIATWYGTTKEGTRPAGAGRLWVEDGRAIWSQVETHPDDDGKFRISGLEDGPHRLRVPAEDWGCALHPDAYAQVDFLTHAPDEHVTVDADRSLMVIEVADGDHLVQNAVVTFDGRDQIRLNSNTNGEVGVVLRASHRHRVTIEAGGRPPTSLDVTAPLPGERRRERIPVAADATGLEFLAALWTFPTSIDHLRVVGPDDVPVVARCRLLDAAGRPVPCRFVEKRPVVQVVSSERVGLGFTAMDFKEAQGARYFAEVGGDGYGPVKQKLDTDQWVVEQDSPLHWRVVLHPR